MNETTSNLRKISVSNDCTGYLTPLKANGIHSVILTKYLYYYLKLCVILIIEQSSNRIDEDYNRSSKNEGGQIINN